LGALGVGELVGDLGKDARDARVRVLVIDDDPDIIEVLKAIADHHPTVEVVGAASCPEEAVAQSRDAPPDAILLDHYFLTAEPAEEDHDSALGRRPMRGMSGLEAVEFLRAVAPDAVIAVYTGMTGLAGSVENSGADLYLMKGPNPREALDEVAAYVARRRR
jgi:DNA-binding NarL/FixJ family response regulator